jgi:hypothetical protein
VLFVLIFIIAHSSIACKQAFRRTFPVPAARNLNSLILFDANALDYTMDWRTGNNCGRRVKDRSDGRDYLQA